MFFITQSDLKGISIKSKEEKICCVPFTKRKYH